MMATNGGPILMLFNETDRWFMQCGLRRANTRRLRELIEATARAAEPVLRARREAGTPVAGVAWTWTWQRRGSCWEMTGAFEGEAQPHERGPVGAGVTTIDAVQCVRGAPEELAGDTIRIAAVDRGRRVFAFEHLALVRADGSLGELNAALTARWPDGGAS